MGILNGIDVVGYDPETDSNLKKHYSVTKIAGKKECRAALLHECGLTDSDAPVVGIVTRFVAHKGIQLVQQTFQESCSWAAGSWYWAAASGCTRTSSGKCRQSIRIRCM